MARMPGQPTRFVVLATQRSGSTWVVDMLDSHPQVTAYGELMLSPEKDMMLPRDVEYFSEFLARQSPRARRLGSHVLSLRFVAGVFERTNGDAIGFKLMYDDFMRNPELLGYLAAKRVRIIHVVRENVLDVVISREAAQAKGLYHVWGERQVEPVSVELDTKHLIGRLRMLELQQRFARRWVPLLRTPVYEAVYEELLRDPSGFGKLLGVLGADASRSGALGSSLKKVVRNDHADVIANYEAVRRVLAGTRFERLLRS